MEEGQERRGHCIPGGNPVPAEQGNGRSFSGSSPRDRKRQAADESDRRDGPSNLPPRQGDGGDGSQVESEDGAQSQLREKREEKTRNGQVG